MDVGIRVFIDTAPFIYLIENHPVFGAPTEQYLSTCVENESMLFTSVISYLEFCVVPLREKRHDIIEKFEELLADLSIEMQSIDLVNAKYASQLRSQYAFLKTADAIQLAMAVTNKCNIFLTNDEDLSSIKEINTLVISKIEK